MMTGIHIRYRTILLTALLLAVSTSGLRAFSLLGPFTSWQTSAIGYDLPIGGGESGGPMNIGEEYRLTIPVLTYGYDATFKNYFGTKGIAAIDEAFAILNALPHADQIDLNAFPLQAKGPINFTAANLGIMDIKSLVLGYMLAQYGIGNPERYTWCLRDRSTLPTGEINYLVIQRNFDPVNYGFTNTVNGTVYTYTVFDPIIYNNVTYADAVERPVDPAADDFTTLAGVDNFDPLRGINLNPGEYFTGLTRDDAGALRYIYRSSNYNIEDVLAGINLSTNPVNGSPFVPIGQTNAFQTNSLVGLAVRPGIGAVRFEKIDFDSVIGTTLGYTNDYVDIFVTNNIRLEQRLERVLTAPDILFVADDLGIINFSSPLFMARTISGGNWVDHSGDNTINATGNGGPGVATGSIVVSFSKLGPSRINQSPFFLDENSFLFGELVFGHFDTKNIFAVFPDGSSVQEIEQQIGTAPIGSSGSPFLTVGTGLTP